MPDAPPLSFPEAKGGTRLVPLWSTTAEGTAVFRDWYDRGLDERCWFSTWTDGTTLRCFPHGAYTGGYFFMDSGCTVPAVPWNEGSCQPVPRFVHLPPVRPCPATRLLFRVGPAVGGAQLYNKVRGECRSVALRPGDRIHQVGEPIAPEMLVAATVKAGTAAGGLVPAILEAEDGSSKFWSFRDERTGADCTWERAGDGRIRCLPRGEPLAWWSDYLDGACTQPAVRLPPNGCRPPEELRFPRRSVGVCPTVTSVWTAGERQARAYVGTPQTCRAEQSAEPGVTYAPGRELPASDFVEGSFAALPDAGRLRRMAVVTAAGVASADAFWDSRLRRRCLPRLAADGVQRCLPVPADEVGPLLTVFDNPTCMGQGRNLATPSSCEVGFVYIPAGGPGCPLLTGVRPVEGAPYRGAAYANQGSCQPYALDRAGVFVAVGDPIAPAEFVEIRSPGPAP